MQEITSRENKIFKEALKLQKKKYRDEYGIYLIEGANLVEEAFKCDIVIKTIFYKDGYDGLRFSHENSFVLSTTLFNELSNTENSQGIIAVVEKKEFYLKDFVNLSDSNFLIIDKVQDPGNIGTLLRTADAGGYSLVILIKGSADIYQPKVVRSATGSLFRIPTIYVDSYEELKKFIKQANKRLVATILDTDLFYYDVDLSKDIALIIGNEGNGIDKELIDLSDIRIKIPMVGNIESLNCAVSAGILIYERIRKCKKD